MKIQQNEWIHSFSLCPAARVLYQPGGRCNSVDKTRQCKDFIEYSLAAEKMNWLKYNITP